MPSFIRHPKDFWSGLIFLVSGAAAVLIAHEYSMGSAGKMGPAYFPTVLGYLLAFLGVVALVRSFLVPGQPVDRFYYKNLLIILGAVIIFGALVRGAGLIIATMLLVVIGSTASGKFRLMQVLLLAIGLTAFSALVFVKLLGLPLPLVGSWFGS